MVADREAAEHDLRDDAERQQHAEPREVAAEWLPAPRERARGDRRDTDEARDDAVAVLDPGVGLERRRHAAVALGPVRAAEARAGQADRGAREDDQRQGGERHLGDALVGRGGSARGGALRERLASQRGLGLAPALGEGREELTLLCAKSRTAR